MLKPEEYFEPLPASEKNEEYIAMESKSFAKDVWERFCSNKRALAGLILLGIIVVIAVIGPWISPYPYDGMDTMISIRVRLWHTGLEQIRWEEMNSPEYCTEHVSV